MIKKTFYKYKKLKYIDLSADFRISNAKLYSKTYKKKHYANDLIKYSLYSISELNKHRIKNFRIIANPGCYPTSIQLPLIPIIKKNLIDFNNIIIDSKSGYSGAGKNFKKNLLMITYLVQRLHMQQNFIDMFKKSIKSFLNIQKKK